MERRKPDWRPPMNLMPSIPHLVQSAEDSRHSVILFSFFFCSLSLSIHSRPLSHAPCPVSVLLIVLFELYLCLFHLSLSLSLCLACLSICLRSPEALFFLSCCKVCKCECQHETLASTRCASGLGIQQVFLSLLLLYRLKGWDTTPALVDKGRWQWEAAAR